MKVKNSQVFIYKLNIYLLSGIRQRICILTKSNKVFVFLEFICKAPAATNFMQKAPCAKIQYHDSFGHIEWIMHCIMWPFNQKLLSIFFGMDTLLFKGFHKNNECLFG